jgi:hypothetical protein
MKKRLFVLLSVLCLAGSVGNAATCLEHTIWDNIMKVNVDKEGLVDYESIRVNKGGDLYQYLTFLETADLGKCSDAEKLAFWINAYNAHMVKMVLARPTMKQVSEDFALFGEKFKVAKINLSLNDIEHRVLRSNPKKGGPIEGVSLKTFDPRIHFALVCGAIDCPKLNDRAYAAASLDSTLQSNAVNFANNPKHVRIEGDKLIVSSLMHWYEEDFAKMGGPGAYITSLIDPKLRPDAAAVVAKIKTDFPDKTTFRYDWTLNSIKNKKPAAPVPVK